MDKQFLRLNVLSAAILIASPALAMQPLSDDSMSSVIGQDGIEITSTMDAASIGRIKWEDETNRELQLNTVNITPAQGNSTVSTTVALELGSDTNGVPGLKADITLSAMTFDVGDIAIDDVSAAGGVSSLGKLTFKTTRDTVVKVATTNGLFNKQGAVDLEMKLDGADIYLTDSQNGHANFNQVILSDTRFDVKVTGSLYVDDTKGLVLDADKVILRNDGSRAGMQFEVMHKGNVSNANDVSTYSTAGARGLIRIGVSGELDNVDVNVRGTNATGATLGDATLSVLGSKGIAIRVDGEFANAATSSNPLSFDLSEAGANGYGLRFSDLRSFNPNNAKARFSLGNTYVSLLNVNSIGLPTTKLNQAANTQINGLYLAKQMAENGDYTQSLPSVERLALMIRGLELQGVPQKTEFILNSNAANTVTAPTNTADQWSLAPMVYNLNANATITNAGSGTINKASDGTAVQFDNRLGVSLGMSTDGLSADGLKTTSFLLLDTTKKSYVGLRNIDSLLTAEGQLGIDSNAILLNFGNFNLALTAELAAGVLPDAANLTRFQSQADTLFALRARLKADYLNVDLIPGQTSNNFLGFAADLKLSSDAKSFVHIVDTVDSTTIGLDSLTGRARITDGKVDVLSDGVNFSSTVQINPDNRVDEVFRVGDINFYPATAAGTLSAPQRLGEMVMTGGRLESSLTIKPVN